VAGSAAPDDAPAGRWRGLVVASAAVAIGLTLGCASTASARRATVGQVQRGKASYYAPHFAGRKTASGERYDPNLMTAAHKTLPLGTRIRVTRTDGASVVVKVNDRCGCTHGRILDLSEKAARKLNMMKVGVVDVKIEVLGH
jgi:rare lipoprotein A